MCQPTFLSFKFGGVFREEVKIHFEDLDPHRFEDLVRELIYDFRDWQTIEAFTEPRPSKTFVLKFLKAVFLCLRGPKKTYFGGQDLLRERAMLFLGNLERATGFDPQPSALYATVSDLCESVRSVAPNSQVVLLGRPRVIAGGSFETDAILHCWSALS